MKDGDRLDPGCECPGSAPAKVALRGDDDATGSAVAVRVFGVGAEQEDRPRQRRERPAVADPPKWICAVALVEVHDDDDRASHPLGHALERRECGPDLLLAVGVVVSVEERGDGVGDHEPDAGLASDLFDRGDVAGQRDDARPDSRSRL